MTEHVTLIRPDPRASGGRAVSSGFPADLLGQSAERLRVIALLYAFVFLMAGIFPALLFPGDRARFLSSVLQWGPAVLGIVVGLAVAAVIRNARLPLPAVTTIGLVFEVVSSYAIAGAEFADPAMLENHQGMMGLSWVAVWVVLFTVVVPTAPRRAVVAALASVSAVPVTLSLVLASGATTATLDPGQFFFGLVFPYLLVVGMAYVGARVVYGLGTEIRRARDLGSYRLEEKLGEGGMGEVWRARHRLLARPAAIKLIRSDDGQDHGGPSAEAVQRFEREAQATARLRSPHTVELFDFGRSADGVFYYVMELLEGLDTDVLLRRFGPIPPARAIYLLRQVCHSLSEADACGLVHRDIKPANIFLCRYGEEYDFVKVLDFGIVRAVGPDTRPGPGDTRDQAIQGTPAFMAPEQAMGSGIDGRSDIYATGCLAYWLLTGQYVFTADSPMGLLVQHAGARPVPPSARTSQPIPPALDELVLACLAKDPAERPQTAKELARRLDELAGSEPWTLERAEAWWIGNRVLG
jgi:hypothetical protein